MKSMLLIEFDDEKVADVVEREVASRFGLHTRLIRTAMPRVRMRGWQVNGEDVLSEVARLREKDEVDYAIGFVKDDIFVPNMNFIFGLATKEGRSAVVSSNRLKSSHPGLYRDRLTKEVMHELGHVFGLGHCDDILCVMHFSNSLQDTDTKSSKLCSKCGPRLVPP